MRSRSCLDFETKKNNSCGLCSFYLLSYICALPRIVRLNGKLKKTFFKLGVMCPKSKLTGEIKNMLPPKLRENMFSRIIKI